MPAELCEERLKLANRVSNAVVVVYDVSNESKKATERKAANLPELQDLLARAKQEEREAVRALTDHTKAHGCTV